MFGLSLTKVLFTVLVVLAIWYGYRWWNRVETRRQMQVDEEMRAEIHRATRSRRRRRAKPGDLSGSADETVRCGVCDIYMAAKQPSNCGRPDCPFPG